MARQQKIVTVFGSSRPSEGDLGYTEAMALGAALAAKGLIVCTGGYGGVMEGASRGAREAGGSTLAVTAEFFRVRANRWDLAPGVGSTSESTRRPTDRGGRGRAAA